MKCCFRLQGKGRLVGNTFFSLSSSCYTLKMVRVSLILPILLKKSIHNYIQYVEEVKQHNKCTFLLLKHIIKFCQDFP